MQSVLLRTWFIRWMYIVALAHLATGILLTATDGMLFFDAYHRIVEAGFWSEGAPPQAREQQQWWLSLFGATVQSLALWMLALVHLAARHRSAFAWGSLATGLIVWAPQDMLISLRTGAWPHVWIDTIAVAAMLPPLLWLWWHDRRAAGSLQPSMPATPAARQ